MTQTKGSKFDARNDVTTYLCIYGKWSCILYSLSSKFRRIEIRFKKYHLRIITFIML
jgi:hypothetical protein